MASTWDYGPLGVELKKNVKDSWWRTFVWSRDDVVGLDAAHSHAPGRLASQRPRRQLYGPLWSNAKPATTASGKTTWRVPPAPTAGASLPTPASSTSCSRRSSAPVEEQASEAYLRPETAQGIFVNFDNVHTATRKRLPFGIAQIGKAFRNEITTGNFIFRTREFEAMEIEYFVMPGQDEEAHEQWIKDCVGWYTGLGVSPDRIRVRQHDADELSHYSKATYDLEYLYPWGWGEIQGVANRTDYDLKAHTKASGQSLTYFDQDSGQHVVPYVIEPAAGVDRSIMTFLVDAYTEEDAPTASGGTQTRVLLKLHPEIAPVKVAVLPLSRNARLTPTARKVLDTVRGSGLIPGFVQYDDTQSIGRRYRRQDEIGTPLCVTVDFDTLDDNAVTIRDRDTMHQERVAIDALPSHLAKRLSNQ